MRTVPFKDIAAYYGAEAAACAQENMLRCPGKPIVMRLLNPKNEHVWRSIMEHLWLLTNYGSHDQDWPDEWRPFDNVRIVPETAEEIKSE